MPTRNDYVVPAYCPAFLYSAAKCRQVIQQNAIVGVEHRSPKVWSKDVLVGMDVETRTPDEAGGYIVHDEPVFANKAQQRRE